MLWQNKKRKRFSEKENAFSPCGGRRKNLVKSAIIVANRVKP
jgi:hypothetical protein